MGSGNHEAKTRAIPFPLARNTCPPGEGIIKSAWPGIARTHNWAGLLSCESCGTVTALIYKIKGLSYATVFAHIKFVFSRLRWRRRGSANAIRHKPRANLADKANGNTFTAKSAQTQQDIINGGVTRLVSPATYMFDMNAQTLTFTLDGESYTLDISAGSSDYAGSKGYARVTVSGDNIFGVRTPTDSPFASYLAGNSDMQYAMPLRSYAVSADGATVSRSYGVFGLETPASALPSATATYGGGFLVDLFDVNSNDVSGRTTLYGGATINVDFANTQVTGGSLDVTSRAEGFDPTQTASGSFAILPVSFSGNQFNAPLNANVTDLTIDPDATINGTFFGNAAQEVGGSITFTGTLDGTDRLATGIFTANEP